MTEPTSHGPTITAAVHAIAGALALVSAAGWWFLRLSSNLDRFDYPFPYGGTQTVTAGPALWPVPVLAAIGVASLVAAGALVKGRSWGVPVAAVADMAGVALGALAAWDAVWNLAVPLLGAFLPALGTLGLPGVRPGASPTGTEGPSP